MPEKEILINSVYQIQLMAYFFLKKKKKGHVSQFRHPCHKLYVTFFYHKVLF